MIDSIWKKIKKYINTYIIPEVFFKKGGHFFQQVLI